MAALLTAAGAGLALAMEPPAASDELILLPEMLSWRGDMRSQLELDIVMRAAIRVHPELIDGTRRDGFYRLDIALNPDGSVYRSGIAFFPGARNGTSYFNDRALHRIIPRGVSTLSIGPTILRGESVGGAGIAPNPIEIAYGILPVDYDPSRAAERVDAQVLEQHAELIQPVRDGMVNLLTVLMTEDGRIDRTHVARKDLQRIREWRSPPDFSVMGLDGEQLGPSGVLVVFPDPADATTPAPFHIAPDRGAEESWLVVHYAWPRREGEPARSPPRGREWLLPELQAPTITEQLASRYCSGAITAVPGNGDVCWIVFTREGRVMRTGKFESGEGGSYGHEELRALHPDLDLTDINSEYVRFPADDRQVRLLLAWGVLDPLGVLDRSEFLLR